MKLFFVLLVLFSHVYENKLESDLGPISFIILYIIFSLDFFLSVSSGFQPNVHEAIV